ncbi:MAG: methionyl-tRNA formyltransferase [Candidatus Vogelbacteria bacterium CG10_big_fil_rev_8_21_14_0_10_45_14]|uniref:Methionyl-tRNA formyltransferase n=1 Tax=Candidatus Vogelbacteria bacterium CG10_big_fil_rev_8_21_14_0_10_45_14 TaxID=1975042 RepID=A0A2H0RKH1_9BACT|nr:MAG: methionyl-tRNA formyltransferase [Candidatus Vogelbacteria bacterium CG10_big_fil_rev_8_21_14_0_10_45_14]
MNFIFFGTSNFAVDVLRILIDSNYTPSLVVTMPDAPSGRNNIMTPPPVKVMCIQQGISFIQPISLKKIDDYGLDILTETRRDLFIVVDYGNIIPSKLLNLPKKSSLNVHVSLLPKYRGASPMQSALLSGDSKTGVTIMEVVEKMDEGKIVAQREIDLSQKKLTFSELAEISAKIGGELLVSSIPNWLEDTNKGIIQDESLATYTVKFDSNDGFIDSSIVQGISTGNVAKEAERKVRALNPSPGTWTLITARDKEIRLKILSSHLEGDTFIPDKVIPAGKKEMNWKDFQRGNLRQ